MGERIVMAVSPSIMCGANGRSAAKGGGDEKEPTCDAQLVWTNRRLLAICREQHAVGVRADEHLSGVSLNLAWACDDKNSGGKHLKAALRKPPGLLTPRLRL